MTEHSWREALVAYKSPASLALLLLGFAAGLPTMLVFTTLSVWLREAGVARETIGFASWLGLVYAFKWVWSPMLDQWRLPLIGKLGRRRSWLVFSQTLIAIGLLGMALCNPQQHLPWLIGLALVVAFASATQDIAIDAYRLEIAEDTRQAALAACYMTGYRAAVLLASAGALFFAEWFGSSAIHYSQSAWGLTYALFSLLILPGLLTSLLMREPPVNVQAQPIGGSTFAFNHQLLSVLQLLVLLISLPAMLTALTNSAWPRAALYAIFIAMCLTPRGRKQIRPVRELLSKVRRPLLLAVHGKGVPQFDFVHQAVSVIVLIILLVTGTAMTNSFHAGKLWLGSLYLLIALSCVSAPGRLLMAPVLTPITEFVRRYRWQALLLLGLISTYRLSDTVMGVMAGVFYIDMGFSKDVIATVSKLFGVIMTLLGAAAGGLLIARFSILPILFLGGAASAATNLLFSMLAHMGPISDPSIAGQDVFTLLKELEPHVSMFVLTIMLDNFSGGLAASAFVAYLSSLTNLKFSATQYAMLSSTMLLLPRFIGGYSGSMVESMGYEQFFFFTAILGIPTLLLIGWLWLRRNNGMPNGASTVADEVPAVQGSAERS
ncbi:MFS transporter AmpG [Pseudomonas panipatensis]|uniref:MFS transporter, PAT family, beta-lactamase induction signal transducer AmpG n=1 Tax=Pseudomonas panipatensis TaxID=428992 RepID=A0A1G8KKG4_9PSED|nr:MFS transporter AmpG [Pseudomonas panipatensis]SDI43862.1 MFS transporter, PAT family, beta-lactamase induction signal transducer AmpG [Pseudomonas panipatensis]SMP69861.1 MFS transporter, PAT family, beta-lactamase induction signal transducer AmpG [Pseudomonas panipatensis]